MSNINPLKFGVTGNQYIQKDVNEDATKQAQKESVAENQEKKQLGSNEVFGFLAAQNTDLIPVKPTRTYNVSKYVNAEQEARIADSMRNGYVPAYESGYAATNEIAPDLSDRAKEEITLAYVNSLI